MMQYGNKFSIKNPSETNNNFKNSYLKSIIFEEKLNFLRYSNEDEDISKSK